MNPDRAIAVILGVSLAVVLTLGIWLLRRAHSDSEPPAVTPNPTASSPPAAPPTATPGAVAAVAQGYRLAGTVVGDLSYAIIEDPHGGNQLYRPGQTIPGVGEVTAIEEDRIIVAGSDGSIALQLAPAPTATAAPLPTQTGVSAPAPDSTPARRSRRDRSGYESSP